MFELVLTIGKNWIGQVTKLVFENQTKSPQKTFQIETRLLKKYLQKLNKLNDDLFPTIKNILAETISKMRENSEEFFS